MIEFADLVRPVGEAAFFRDHYRAKPLVIDADARRAGLFSFDRLNDLLAQSSTWTPATLRLWIDKRAVPANRYCTKVLTLAGEELRPDPKKVAAWLGEGASLVLNGADTLTAELRAVARALEGALFGYASANVYCSFGGVQAFDSHYDDHEVFAFQIAGEKTWRIYEGRLDNPVGQPPAGPNAQRVHDQAKGKVLFERRMKPGEVMYLPRGQYHDALADTAASLHVTFSVQPMNGVAIVGLLEKEAMRESLFRDDLPAPRGAAGEAALRKRLDELAGKLAALMRDPAFAARVTEAQRTRRQPRGEFALPERSRGERYAVASANVRLGRNEQGVLITDGARGFPVPSDLVPFAQWMLGAADFARAEAEAEFRWIEPARLGEFLAQLAKAGVVVKKA